MFSPAKLRPNNKIFFKAKRNNTTDINVQKLTAENRDDELNRRNAMQLARKETFEVCCF